MKILAAILRIVRIYALTLWVGGLVLFIVVAAVAFGSLPSTHEAGMVVRGCLLALHNIGLVCGVLYLFATLPLRLLGERNKANAIGQALVLIMLALTFYSQDSIIPHMERDRLALGGEVTQDNASRPEHMDFDRLHNRSTTVETGVLLCGLLALALAVNDKE